MIMDLCFVVLCALESVNRWRLSTIKVPLELGFIGLQVKVYLILQTVDTEIDLEIYVATEPMENHIKTRIQISFNVR